MYFFVGGGKICGIVDFASIAVLFVLDKNIINEMENIKKGGREDASEKNVGICIGVIHDFG